MAYLPLSTANLPNPVIDPAQDKEPRDYFETFLYTGNGAGLQVGDVIKKPADTTTISNSSSFARNGNASLSRTPSVAGNRRTFTFSCWVKRVAFGSNQTIFSSFNGNSSYGLIRFNTDDTLEIFSYESNVGYNQRHKTIRTFKDASIWHHILCVWDTTQATSSDRFKLYVDGILELNLSVATYPSQNDDLYFNETELHYIGCTDTSAGGDIRTNFLDGYLAEIHYTDGTAYTSTDFGNFDANGIWIPKAVSGLTYGTNGFYLDFDPTNVSQGSDQSATQDTLSGELVHMQFENAFDDSHGKSVSVGGSSNHQFQTSDPKFGTYHIYVPNDTYFDVQGVGRPSNWTHSLWFQATSNVDALIGRWYENYAGELISISGDGTVGVYYGNGSGWTSYSCTYKGINVIDGNWHHVAITHDGSTMKLYIDGRFRNSVSGSVTSPAFDYMRFNAYVNTGGNRQNVSYDQYRMFNEAATADEIYRLYLERQDTITSVDGSSTVLNINGFVETNIDDTPTDNFATLNPAINIDSATISEGNLAFSKSGKFGLHSTLTLPKTGKYYFEVQSGINSSGGIAIGLFPNDKQLKVASVGDIGYDGGIAVRCKTSGSYIVWNSSSDTSGFATQFPNYSVIGVAVDLENNQISWYSNGTLAKQVTTDFLLTKNWNVAVANETGAQTIYASINFGQRTFSQTPPTGFVALSENNITVDDQNIESPDFVWIKNRNGVQWHQFYDSVRGATNAIASNAANGEDIRENGLLNFNTNGFTVGGGDANVNNSGDDYVAWCWKANGSGVSNTDGSITSTVSANTTSGFSIVSYTGTGANATVGHGLDSAPEMIIFKERNGTTNWPVYHSGLSSAAYALELNQTLAQFSYPAYFQSTAPTSSVFYIGTDTYINNSSDNYIAYCFHSVEGFSKFGSYVGNGSTDGPFVYTGFRPAWVLIKRATTAGAHWRLNYTAAQTANGTGFAFMQSPSAASADITNEYDMDILSNGFKLRDSTQYENLSGATFVYAAFAENPFKYSLAR